MEKLAKITTLICLLSFSTYLHAQVKIGPKVGLNLATMTMKYSGVSFDPSIRPGFNVGVVSEIPLTSSLFLQPGFSYSEKGSKYSISDVDMKMSPTYLELPVNVLYKFDTHPVKLFLLGGPCFAYGIGGRYEVMGEKYDISYGADEEDDMRAFDLGVNLGGGVEIDNFQVSVEYGIGITNLSTVTDDDASMKNRVWGISIAYMFGGK